ncbi:MAG: hypothetical protein DHS20C18_55040 [Saprospiraceae bacterium]|nr:MAG: hypothetical protein DHS20C18_55040 [Saprospiraceae bacterium]
MRPLCLLIILFELSGPIFGQSGIRDSFPDPYHVKPWLSLSLTAGAFLAQPIGLERNNRKPEISNETLENLVRKGVHGFDHIGLTQDLSKRKRAGKLSDYGMIFGVFSPALLFLDRKCRHNWLDFIIMHGEAQALAATLHTWGPFGPLVIDRYRPVVYYEDAPLNERNFGALRNSFFSGHTSVVATGTFLTAQIYLDHHPELKGQKWIFYGLATLPPAWVAILRVKALRHFPTDTVIGGITGAATGLLIPWIHRKMQGRMNFSLIYGEETKGMGMILRF